MDTAVVLKNVMGGISDGHLVSSVMHNTDDVTLKWLPLLESKNPNLILGISVNGLWAKGNRQNVFEFGPESSLVFLLPCLEFQRDHFYGEILRLMTSYGFPVEAIDTFPVSKLIITGLNSWSEHWTDCALRWITPLDLTPEVCSSLQVVSETKDKRIPQKLRQEARRILKLCKAKS